MAAEKTKGRRIDSLARPKPVTAQFIDDHRSVYWKNNISKDWDKNDKATKFALSERLEQLVLPKPVHKEWQGDRPSPIWLVNKSALKAQPSERLISLSSAKQHHREFQDVKPVYTVVSEAAKNATASQRVEMLAHPKQYTELAIKPDSGWDYSEWASDVSQAALKYEPSGRVLQLATPKDLNKGYEECRPVMWPVTRAAKKALPSIRVQQLSRPKSRSQYKEDYDCNWWKVAPGAKKAHASPRIEELSAPLPRKIRLKKQGVVKS